MTNSKRLTWSLAAIGLIVVSLLGWWWQHREPAGKTDVTAGNARASTAAAPGGPVPVEVARAEARDLSDDAIAVGSLRARQGVTVRPEVGGRIVKLGFADGQTVRRGQLLVQMDDALVQAQLAQAQAQRDIARTTLERNQELVAQNFVTQSVVDQAQANLKVAEAQVALARATAERLRIVAPFDGQAGIRAVNVGDVVKDGADIVSLTDASSVYVDFSLPERYAPRLKLRQPVEVSFDALPRQHFTALVEALEPQVSADGRAILARGRIANEAGLLRPGMFARVRVVLSERPGAILVPEEAIVPFAGKELLVKVIDGPNGPRSQRVEVKTGLRRDGRVELVGAPIAAGDRVVTAGHGRLVRADGLPLQLVELARAAPAAPGSAPASAPRGAAAQKAAHAEPAPIAG
ncbi:MAG TPA: efflux RND transporter periplasmic adaptor subunit [Methylibium sp.]|uniref:efflux RND transporter periplasmic adaptor subunit n=1 Tax=Methylibium sp. TaxID=2067992 RepID=UPI002DBFFDDE|nr:efflux RND transporter periplasmic adaptor subunit [Methylibium sp.]HEU4459441.1 efflux RND transporter periplasmic adaptor subunit [Methylibium sp.]